jgi:hypothetical protein
MSVALNGVFGQVYINGLRYTCLGVPSFSAPLGTSMLPIAGSAEPYLVSKGMIEPVVSMKLLCRDMTAAGTNGNPLSDVFNGYVFGRSAAPAYNNAVLGGSIPVSKPSTPNSGHLTGAGVAFSDGASITLLYGAKIASWSMSGQKSGVVSVDVVITGTGFYQWDIATLGDAINTAITSMLPTTGQCANPLWFNSFTFSEAYLAGKVFSFAMGYSNNLDPNRALDGTYVPSSQDAMSPSGTLTLTLQPIDGSPGDHPETTGGTATVAINNPGATRTVTYLMSNLKSTSPYNRAGSMGRILRNYSFLLAGDCNNLNSSAGRLIIPSASGY